MLPARHLEFETLVIDVANADAVVFAFVNVCDNVAVYIDAVYVVAVVITMVLVVIKYYYF
jgi:hypothetical protein